MVFKRKRDERANLFADLKGLGIDEVQEIPVAVIVPMVVMMWADKKKHEAETDLIHAICNTSPIFLKPTHRQIETWITEAEKIVHEVGSNDEKACQRVKIALSEPLRQTAFAFAVQVLFADEKVTSEEKDKAEQLAGWLDVDRSLAADIIKVVSILRHGRDVR